MITHKAHFKFCKIILLLIGYANGESAMAQWLPNTLHTDLPVYFTYEPVCNASRRQVHVKLLDATQLGTFFKPTNDLKADSILYAIRFKSNGNNMNVVGKAYCEPFVLKDTGSMGFREKNGYESAAKAGFSQCLFDYNDDGIFDGGGTGFAWYFPNMNKTPSEHKYRYELIDNEGPPEAGCPRPKASLNAIHVSEQIWMKLSDSERHTLKEKGDIDVISAKEVGIILQAEKLDKSTPGNKAGSIIGEQVAAANYIDNSVGNGGYSVKGQLGAQVIGALLGSALDTNPHTEFKIRYTIKMNSGEILTAEKTSYRNEFNAPNGVCVLYPSIEQVDQFLCEATVSSFKSKYLIEGLQNELTISSKETRLRELKNLFDKGLVTDKAYTEQQKIILNN